MDKSGKVGVSFTQEMAIPSFINTEGFEPPEERRLFGSIRKYLPTVLGGISKKITSPSNDEEQRSLQAMPYCDELDDFEELEAKVYVEEDEIE